MTEESNSPNSETSPQEPERLTEEQRYLNMKAMLGDDADKYFVAGTDASPSMISTSPLSSAGGATKLLVYTVVIFVLVVVGTLFIVNTTTNTEITVPPTGEVLPGTPGFPNEPVLPAPETP